MAKYINLTKGQRTLVDDDTFEKVGHLKWHAAWSEHNKCFYAARTIESKGVKQTLKLHRVILGLRAGDGIKADHISLDSLDNRRDNLRKSTNSQNITNSGRRSSNTSGFKGVFWRKDRKMWAAQIRKSRTKKHLGFYYDPAMSALAYDLAAINLHGDFARVNVLTKFARVA